MRPGMFVTATFHGARRRNAGGRSSHRHFASARSRLGLCAAQPTTNSGGSEVVGGDMLPGNMQEVVSGLAPGQQVIANALEFQNTAQQ